MSMKKLLLALLLLTPGFAQAAVTFFWRAEGTTLDATHDKTAGDSTAQANSTISISATALKIGSNGMLTVDGNDNFQFDSASIVSTSVGSMAAWFQYKTAVSSNGLSGPIEFQNSGSVNDIIDINPAASQEFRLDLAKNGGSALALTTTGVNAVVDTWYFVVARYDIPNDKREISVYTDGGGNTLTLVETVTDLSTDLANTQPTAIDQIKFGNTGSNANPTWTDNVFISQSYSEPLQNFAFITSFQPAYTAGPTNGTFTNSTLPFTYTPNQDGTTFAAACANGQTISTGPNVESGTCSGGAAVGTGNDASVAGVSDLVTITGLAPSTIYDVYIVHKSSIGGYSAVSSLADRTTTGGTAVTYSAGPNHTSITNGYNTAGTLTGSGFGALVSYSSAYSPGHASAATCAQIRAAQDPAGVAALLSANETWTTGVANDYNVSAANKPPKMDLASCAHDGTNSTTVTESANQVRTARAGYAIVTLSAHAADGICNLDAYFNPDCADLDAFEYKLVANENSDCAINIATDGRLVIYDHTDGANTGPGESGDSANDGVADCAGRITFPISYEYSRGTGNALFTSPSVGNFTTDDTIYVNNNAPTCSMDPANRIVLLTQSVGMPTIDLISYGTCSDLDADALSVSISSGTLPTGTSLGGTGNKDWTGTPSVENEAGSNITVAVTDVAGDATSYGPVTVYVVNTWTATNCVGLTPSACATAVVAAAGWRTDNPNVSIGTISCDANPANNGKVTAQTPTAGTQIAANAQFSLTVGLSCGGAKLRQGLGLGLGIP